MEITYSTKLLTLGNMSDALAAGKGDYDAMIRLIAGRTNLLPEQVRELDIEEAGAVLKKILEALSRSIVLNDLGKQLDS